ncbi:hypothetical protein EJ08DRAFT_451558 [Tothia fuscella]|uniref:Uncharacterized protein n=1 Tax=Tothia fuscella TaxID=1048955 RepID=A0A9P4NJ75_9PEZI|nr:hypothetical protein EJ08DRAFT_451558 [Tothia fuscella]
MVLVSITGDTASRSTEGDADPDVLSTILSPSLASTRYHFGFSLLGRHGELHREKSHRYQVFCFSLFDTLMSFSLALGTILVLVSLKRGTISYTTRHGTGLRQTTASFPILICPSLISTRYHFGFDLLDRRYGKLHYARRHKGQPFYASFSILIYPSHISIRYQWF